MTSVPGQAVPRQIAPYDKVVHFAIYGLLAVLLSRDLMQVGRWGHWRAAVMAFAISVAFGAVDEWHQGFIPGRATDPADWRADSIGAAGGALFFALFSRVRASRAPSTRTIHAK